MKKYVSLSALVLMSVFITACNNNTSLPSENTQKETKTEETVEKTEDYVGLTVEQAQLLAKEKGVPFRVVMKDGEALPATMDYRIGRINAEITGDVVVSYQEEGSEDVVIAVEYDQNSWKAMIPESCSSFFDGCNNCNRVEGSDEAACTRKFCQKYDTPKCLDELTTKE